MHVRVAEIADYFHIDQLRTLAIKRYCALMDSDAISFEGFGLVVVEVYRVLPPNNRSLKSTLCTKAMAGWPRLVGNAEVRDGMASCGECLLDIMALRDDAHKAALRTKEVHEGNVAELRIQNWRKVTAAKTREAERLQEKLDSTISLKDQAESDLATERHRNSSDTYNLNQRLAAKANEASDYRTRMERGEEDLEAYEAEKHHTDRTVAHLLTLTGSEHQRKVFEKLLSLFGGCCGDSAKEALAFKRGSAWVFRCRKCAKGYTVTGPCARRLTQVQ